MRISDRHTCETDLAPGATGLLTVLFNDAQVFEEVDLRWTAPDLVAAIPAERPDHDCELDEEKPALRQDALTIAELLEGEGPLQRSELEQHTSLRWTELVCHVLEPLEARDVISTDGSSWAFRAWPALAYSEIHTVELKLKDWRGAILQATRNQLFADSSWIALPADRLTTRCLAAASEAGVGVIAVVADTAEVAVAATRCTTLHASSRRLVEELLRDALSRTEQRIAGSPMRAGDQRALSQTSRKPGRSPGSQPRWIAV